MKNQRERWAERNYLTLRKRFGESVAFTPTHKNDHLGYSPDPTRQAGEICCLVVRGETGEADLSFGRTNSLLKVAVGEVALQMLGREFMDLQLREGDFVNVKDDLGAQKFVIERCDMRHSPFVFCQLVVFGNEQ